MLGVLLHDQADAAPNHAIIRPAGLTGQAEWQSFLKRFVAAEGRVVDTGNGDISHSEGQGVGLLCAATFGDRASFDLMLGWTERHLTRAYDALHSWCYKPNTANPVSDPNNATDGDLLIGLALFTAADRWGDEQYRRKGLAIARDIQHALLVRTPSGTLLLPGMQGFSDRQDITVNPSYYVFPALRRFAAELPSPVWKDVWDDGLALLSQARFGAWQLPPDWASVARVGRDVRIAGAWPKRCSFDAVRVPLYLCWASLQAHPTVARFDQYWDHAGGARAPAWTDLGSGAQAGYVLTGGMDSVRRFTKASLNTGGELRLQPVAAASDYYSAALTMLVHVAVTEQLASVPGAS